MWALPQSDYYANWLMNAFGSFPACCWTTSCNSGSNDSDDRDDNDDKDDNDDNDDSGSNNCVPVTT